MHLIFVLNEHPVQYAFVPYIYGGIFYAAGSSCFVGTPNIILLENYWF